MENITIKQDKRSKKLEINIKTVFFVENINGLKSEIQNSLNNSKQIIINLQSIENIDIGGIQFIYALKKEAKEKDVEFHLFFEGNVEISTLLKKTGFDFFFNKQ